MIKETKKVEEILNKLEEFNIIEDTAAENKEMTIIIDGLNIEYKGVFIKNSVKAISLVLKFFKSFCKKHKLDCGNLYVVNMIYKGYNLYYGVYDGSMDDVSVEFDEYCEKKRLCLDAGDEDDYEC